MMARQKTSWVNGNPFPDRSPSCTRLVQNARGLDREAKKAREGRWVVLLVPTPPLRATHCYFLLLAPFLFSFVFLPVWSCENSSSQKHSLLAAVFVVATPRALPQQTSGREMGTRCCHHKNGCGETTKSRTRFTLVQMNATMDFRTVCRWFRKKKNRKKWSANFLDDFCVVERCIRLFATRVDLPS